MADLESATASRWSRDRMFSPAKGESGPQLSRRGVVVAEPGVDEDLRREGPAEPRRPHELRPGRFGRDGRDAAPHGIPALAFLIFCASLSGPAHTLVSLFMHPH